MIEKKPFGHEDNSYQSAGAEPGLQKLSEDFYFFMRTLPEAQAILKMHPKDLTKSIEKLALFLCGWLGGPKLFSKKYGPIHIPKFHSHFKIGSSEKEAWLLCMQHAIAQQNYSDDFKEYLLIQLRVPAERIQQVCNIQS